MKKLVTSVAFVVFIGATLFNVFSMNHGSTTNSDCPLSPIHVSVCPTDGLSVFAHYISMYQVFTTGLVSSTVTQVALIFLLFVTAIFILRKYLTPILSLFILSRNFGAKLYRPQALTHWLSLLVNSPSFN